MEVLRIEKNDTLERLLRSGDYEARVRRIVGAVLKEAATATGLGIRGALKHDPRMAYKAVKHSVYKKVLGGSLSILSRKTRSGSVSTGASRRGRSARTAQVMSYAGEDRGFILRFLNSGTGDRTVGTMNGHAIRRGSVAERRGGRTYKGGIGNRGAIAARNFFGHVAQRQLDKAAGRIAELIEAEFAKLING